MPKLFGHQTLDGMSGNSNRFRAQILPPPHIPLQANQTETAESLARKRRKIWETPEESACHQGNNQDPNLIVSLNLRGILRSAPNPDGFSGKRVTIPWEWAPKM